MIMLNQAYILMSIPMRGSAALKLGLGELIQIISKFRYGFSCRASGCLFGICSNIDCRISVSRTIHVVSAEF